MRRGSCEPLSPTRRIPLPPPLRSLSSASFLGGAHAAELRVIFVSMLTVVSYALFMAATQWLGSVVALYWQKSLIGQYQEVYFKNKTLYAANKMVPCLDNMDQRIADDTRNFTQGLATFLFGSVNGTQGAMQVGGARHRTGCAVLGACGHEAIGNPLLRVLGRLRD
jgi:hypothetical protein